MSLDDVLERAFQSRAFSKVFFVVERKMKEWLFDCQSCGNCVLSHTGFVCPMRCPKGQRNGPCGGAMDGHCEVDRERDCAWVAIYERMEALGQRERFMAIHEPKDWREDRHPGFINKRDEGHGAEEAGARGKR